MFKPILSSGANSFSEFIKRENEAIQSVEEMASRYSAASAYRLTRLRQHSSSKRTISECLSFYAFLVNSEWEDIQTTNRLANHLVSSAVMTFAEKSGVIKIENRNGQTRYVTCLEPRVYPSDINPVQIADLLYARQDFIETQSFSILNNSDAVEKLRRKGSHMISGGQASEDEIRAIAIVIVA